jgi:hypothetical protein
MLMLIKVGPVIFVRYIVAAVSTQFTTLLYKKTQFTTIRNSFYARKEHNEKKW